MRATTRSISVPLAALLTAAAFAGPAAAIPADAGPTPPTPQHIVQPVSPADARSSGFDWGSAGIGGVGALAIALAGTTGLRRRRLARLRTIPTR